MPEDWLTDVRKYDSDADESVVAPIVECCGVALRNRDSSLVSFSNEVQVARVRDNFLQKKLGPADPGINNPSGNAAADAELSKNRAQAVAAALTAAGVSPTSFELLKPDQATSTANTPEQARRVEVSI